MNVIDALVVTLGLDASKFTAGQKQAQDALKKTGDEADKQRKSHEEQAKKTAEAYGKVRDSIMGVAAAIVTAVAGGEFLAYLTKNDAAAGRLATNIGTTAREVSILEGVWRRLGSTASDADGFLRNTNKILEEIELTGTSQSLSPFVQAGLNVAAFRDAKTYEERATMLAQAAKRLTPQHAQFRLQAAGYSEDTVGVLLRNADALNALFENQKKLNAVNDDGELAQARQRAWDELGQSLEGTGREIADFFTPALVGALNALRDFVVWTRDNVPAAVTIIGSLGSAMLLMKGYALNGLGTAMGGALGGRVAALGGLAGRGGLVGLAGVGGYLGGTLLNNLFKLDEKLSGDAGMPFDLQAGTVIGGAPPIKKRSMASGNFSDLERKWGLPVGLLDQMWRQESGRGLNMVSAKGAKGHFQFMDATAKQYGLSNPFDLGASADAAGHYMHDLLGANGGDIARALAAYNEGQGNLNAGRMPLETQNYVASIMGGMSAAQSRGSGSPSVSVGNVTINTSASTMTGVGEDMVKGMHNYLMAQQANTGVN